MSSVLKKRKSETSANYEQLHRKNPFKDNEPNFHELGESFPSLKKYLKGNAVDWKDPKASREVTKVLLQSMFSINLEIPTNHLCPPLPNRINYLCWLSDLLGDSSGKPHRVLDVGVGPLCIYPILGHKIFQWQFVGSEIDEESIQFGLNNISSVPGLSRNIRLCKVAPSQKCQQTIVEDYLSTFGVGCFSQDVRLLPTLSVSPSCSLVHDSQGPILAGLNACPDLSACSFVDIVMSNPPFYDHEEQINSNNHSICTGSENEMRTLGGEVAFICGMIADSLQLKHSSIIWFTSMVGKKASLSILKDILINREQLSSSQVFTTVFRQGRTNRWGIAWTFKKEAAQKYKEFVEETRRLLKQLEDIEWKIQVSVGQMIASQLKDEVKTGESVLDTMSSRIATAVAQHNDSTSCSNSMSLGSMSSLILQSLDRLSFLIQWNEIEVGKLEMEIVIPSDNKDSIEVNVVTQFASNIGALVDDVEAMQKNFMNMKTELENNIVEEKACIFIFNNHVIIQSNHQSNLYSELIALFVVHMHYMNEQEGMMSRTGLASSTEQGRLVANGDSINRFSIDNL